MEPIIDQHILYKQQRKKSWRFVGTVLAVVALVLGLIFYFLCIDAPRGTFPQTLSIAKGSSVRVATTEAQEKNLVRSSRLLELYVTIIAGNKVVSGDYLFSHRTNVAEVAHRITKGLYGESQIRITIPEGSTAKDIARIADAVLPNFDSVVFLQTASTKEGFLFPDTYFFFPSVTETEVIQRLERNFNDHIADVDLDITASKHTLNEIVTMASIIEREASSDPVEQATISGILWKRISKGIALQVDAPFWYLLGKGSSDLTVGDLKIDSRYNTYRNKGLPPGPIGNPGMAAINAALHPISSNYLYYLHGSDGVVHYAATFEEHKVNKQKYLN